MISVETTKHAVKLRSCASLLAVLVFSSGCATLIPLKAGNHWAYKVKYPDATRGDRHERVRGESNGWFLVEQTYDVRIAGRRGKRNEEPDESRRRNKKDGVWTASADGAGEHLWLKYPASVNDTYTTVDGLNTRVTVLATNETVEVRAGRFECMHYRLETGWRITSDVYAAPGVGVVKIEDHVRYGSTSEVTTQELTQYKLK